MDKWLTDLTLGFSGGVRIWHLAVAARRAQAPQVKAVTSTASAEKQRKEAGKDGGGPGALPVNGAARLWEWVNQPEDEEWGDVTARQLEVAL